MLLGSNGGMLAESPAVPYDSLANSLYVGDGNAAYFDTRTTSSLGDLRINASCVFFGGSGVVVGANGGTDESVSVLYENGQVICRSRDSTASHNIELGRAVDFSLILSTGQFIINSTGYNVRPVSLHTPLYIFAQSGSSGVVPGSYAGNMALSNLTMSLNFRRIHNFIPVSAKNADQATTGALYDAYNTLGGPMENGLYLPVGGIVTPVLS